MQRRALVRFVSLLIAGQGFLPKLGAAQMLETETARQLGARHLKLEAGYERQTSSDGREHALPLVVEYGITNWLEIAAEPVPYNAIRPKGGRSAHGFGDLEVTLTALARHETRRLPAIAFAAEAKLPTAKDVLIGTGRPDYAAYAIASKRVGRFDTHGNMNYTVIGSPGGYRLKNTIGAALATEFHATTKVSVFGEVLGSTASAPEGEGDAGGAGAPVPEAAGGELVGSLGFARYLSRNARFSLGLSYDNNAAFQLRPGFALWFR
jgi:hypothetical protein